MANDTDGGRPLRSDEVKALLRAYTALALARRAAELYNDHAPAHTLLSAAINNQELAMRELDSVLEGVISEVSSVPAPPGAGEEYDAFVM